MSTFILAQALVAYEQSLARVALATILESMPALGRAPSRGFAAAILTGGLRKEVVSTEAYRLMTFGVLSHMPVDDVIQMLDRLVSAGLLERGPNRGALVLSSKGRALLEAPDGLAGPAPLGLLTGVVESRRLDAAVRSGLVDQLRRYRAERARAEEVPEYQVFTEATLRHLAATLPRSEEELQNVPGIGPNRLAAHGAEILRIVAEHGPLVERLLESPDVPDPWAPVTTSAN